MPDIQFTGLNLSFQHGLVHSNYIESSNCVVAIFDRNVKKLVILPEYSQYTDMIQDKVSVLDLSNPIEYEILYGDGFLIDTWNKMLHPKK